MAVGGSSPLPSAPYLHQEQLSPIQQAHPPPPPPPQNPETPQM